MTQRRALLSVSDKTGIQEFAQGLVDRDFEILSTGGTARALAGAGIEVTEVSSATGHPEMMDGRVKTLHPAIHAGILARRDRDDDMAALENMGYGSIDLVAVNLYPFRETVAAGDVEPGEAMEQVDIGGPTMIRAAAKNHRDVWVVTDPGDYERVLDALDDDGQAGGRALRAELAAKVFRTMSGYDGAIAAYLGQQGGPPPTGISPADGGAHMAEEDDPILPASLTVRLARSEALRYGENPDQSAAFYRYEDGAPAGVTALEQLHGKALSYNNILDLDGALLALAPFAYSHRPAVCIVKHTTPAGLAVGESLEAAYRRALATDPMSSFGSIISVNRPVDGATAEAMSDLFIECIVAPTFHDDALEVLTAKKNLRLLEVKGDPAASAEVPDEVTGADWWSEVGEEGRAMARFLASHGRLPEPRVLRSVYGGMLVQTPPTLTFYGIPVSDWKVAGEREPTPEEWDDLAFAWAAVSGVKSNAILLARDGATVGIGAGQMSRVDASELAVKKAADAELEVEGSVLASDAFFPFRDGVDAAAEAGVTAIVQPGGSIRDEEVVAAADEHGVAMVFTGRRVFRH